MKLFFPFMVVAILLSFSANAQIVNIPDANFKAILVGTACALIDTTTILKDVDTNNDGEIQITEAAAVQRLGVASQLVASLTGIEYFINLKMLECGYNQLTNLNVQNLTSLEYLDCQYNQLTNLDVQALTSLRALYCNRNLLVTLNLQTLSNLQTLWCYDNRLTSLFIKNGSNESDIDFFGNPNLAYVCCDATQLTNVQSKITQYGYTNCVVNAACVVGTDDKIATINTLTLQPNPATDIVTFKTDATIEKCEVYDAIGRAVTSLNVQNQSISVAHLPKGVYCIKAYSKDSLFTCKLIKE